MPYMQHFPDLSRREPITVAQLNTADEERRLRGTMLGDELERAGLVRAQVLPVVDTLDGFAFDPKVRELARVEDCLRHRFLFLSKWPGCTTTAVALVDPANLDPINALVDTWFLGRFMDPVVVSEDALLRAIRAVYSPSWRPPPRAPSRPPDEALLPRVQRAAERHHAGKERRAAEDAVQGVVDLFKEDGHRWANRMVGVEKLPCALCGDEPSNRWFVNVVVPLPLRGDRPVFVPTIKRVRPAEPAICGPCVTRDWRVWEADLAAILALLRRGDTEDVAAAAELARRFERRTVGVAAGRCDFCAARSEGVRGKRAFGCSRCMAEAKQAFDRDDAAWTKEQEDRRRRIEEEKNRPFDAEEREEARRIAEQLRARRARIHGAAGRSQADGELRDEWDDVRRCFADSPTSYIFMRHFRERAAKSAPPPDVVDLVARGIALLIESAALDGLRRRHKGMLQGEDDVVGESWPALHAMDLLRRFTLAPETRVLVDTAIVLLGGVLRSGVRYFEWDDGYDEVTEHWARLTTYLYDHRMTLSAVLRAGGLLLSGATAEERLTVAREIHLSRTGGLDARSGISFMVIGKEEGAVPLTREMGDHTVFLPRPLDLSPDEQAYLFYRLSPTGPPRPTILGADDAASLFEGAQGTLMDKLVPRLYRHEYDLRREL